MSNYINNNNTEQCSALGLLPEGKERVDILEIIREHNIENYTITVNAGSKNGDNYLGQIFAVDVTNEDNNKKGLHLIVKCSPRVPAFREFIPMDIVFGREIHMYSKYLPEIYRLQNQHGIQNGFFPVAKLYKYNLTDVDEYLIMENMKKQNFILKSRQSTLDLNYCQLIIKQMAYFHGLSYVIKYTEPDLYEELTANIKSAIFDIKKKEMELWGKQMFNFIERAQKLLDRETEQNIYEKLEQLKHKAFNIAMELYNYELFENNPYSVVIHGDMWTNNMLFKLDENNEPIEICFLDWQISRISSPAIELSYFIYNCTGTELRIKHFDDLIKLYYDSLTDIVAKCGHQVEKWLSYSNLLDEIKKYFIFGLTISCQTIPMFVSDSEEIPEFQKMEKIDEAEFEKWNFETKNTHLYNERMRGVILHANSRGFL